MIDPNTAAGWCSHTHTHTDAHLSHLLRCSCICMSIVIYASWRGCEPIWEQGQHTGQLICKSVAYLWMSMCERVCASVWMFVPINLCMRRGQFWKQAHNHCNTFIHYIYWIHSSFSTSALGVLKSPKFNCMGRFAVCEYVCILSQAASASQRSDPALCSRKSPSFLTSLIIPCKGQREVFRIHHPIRFAVTY